MKPRPFTSTRHHAMMIPSNHRMMGVPVLTEADREKKWQLVDEATKLLDQIRTLGDVEDQSIEGACEDAADDAAWIGNELEILATGYAEDTD